MFNIRMLLKKILRFGIIERKEPPVTIYKIKRYVVKPGDGVNFRYHDILNVHPLNGEAGEKWLEIWTHETNNGFVF